MKLISWNVNGLRACMQKGFLEEFNRLDADFFCLQETKLQPGQLNLDLPGYEQYWNYAEKKGYSGTAIFTKYTPMSVKYGIDIPEFDTEGRVITLEYREFYLVTCYTPNAQRGLARLSYRMDWDEAFRGYLQSLDADKPVILCGDLNVAHQEIDLKNPKSNRGSAGFSDEERESFTKTLSLGFTDTYRYLNPDTTGVYSWWSYMYHARENNAGWRIDYFVVSDRIKETVYKTPVYTDIMGSDHCPVGLEIDLLCNGSLWAPAAMGKAKDLTPPKAPMSRTTKTILMCLLLLMLFVGGIFTGLHLFSHDPEPTDTLQNNNTDPSTLHSGPDATDATATSDVSTPEPNYLIPYLYEEPLYSLPGAANTGTMCLLNEQEHYLLFNPDTWKQTCNYWLRLDVTTSDAFLHIPTVKFEGAQPDTRMLCRYKWDLNSSVEGWFLIGFTDEPTTAVITIDEQVYSVDITPYTEPVPDISLLSLIVYDEITPEQWYSGSDNHIWKTMTLEDAFVLGQQLGMQELHRDANYMFRMELTDIGQVYYEATGNYPLITCPGRYDPGIMQPYQRAAVSATYVEGWVYYGWSVFPGTFEILYGHTTDIIEVTPPTDDKALDIYLYFHDDPLDDADEYLTLDGQRYLLGEDFPHVQGNRETADCWILLELTEAGLENYDPEVSPSVNLMYEMPSDNTYDWGMCPYYQVDEDGSVDKTIPTGWLCYFNTYYEETIFYHYDIDDAINVQNYLPKASE